MNLAIDRTFSAAVIAILFGAVAGVLSAQFPAEANPWMPPVILAITALASLIRRQFNVQD